MKNKKIGIQKFLIRNMVFIAFVSSGLLLFIWAINEYYGFSSESKLLREEYQNSQKAMLRSEVNNVVDYVEYMKAQTQKRLESELQGRVCEAIDIATNIYQENVTSKSPGEIQKMVKDALRPIRFLNGRGYYFAFSMDGIETLFADRPEMEGVDMLPLQNAKGEYVVKDMIEIVKKHQEGFYEYTWTKPSHEGTDFHKIAFVKYFKPFDWAIGTGEYVDAFTNQIKDRVLERIVRLRFRAEGYFFGSLKGGYPLFTDGKITIGSDRIWDMTDPDGVKIIQAQQNAAKNPEGGFVQYRWHKIGSSKPAPKIAFVREIPEWGWTIGAGVYLDTIEKTIAKNEYTRKMEFVKKIIISICVFIGLIVLIWVWAKQVAGKTRKSIMVFESSFKKATTESITIPADDMQFLEFSQIAESANRMIDAQRQSEKSLRESEETYRNLLNNLNSGVVVHASDTSIIIANPTACTLLGLSEDQMLGKEAVDPQWTFIREDGRDMPVADYPVNQVLSTNNPLENMVVGVKRPHPDDVVWLLVNGFAVSTDAGQVEQVVINFVDITERKQIALDLEESEERFKALHNASFGGIAIHDKGLILECNRGLSEITGYEYHELIGMNGLDLISADTRDKVIRNIDTGYEKSYEVTGVRKNGTLYPIRLEARGIPYKGKSARVVEFRDITESKSAEKEKVDLEGQLRQAQKMEAVGRLAGGVAHDFNNMLSVIIGNASLALEEVDPTQPLYAALEEIRKAGDRSADLTRQLLAFARKQTVAPKVLDLNNIVSGMTSMLQRLIGEDIDLKWLPGEKLAPVKVDPGQIDQILANLCVNARDAIADVGNVTIETGNAVLDEAYCKDHAGFLPGAYVLLAVSDNGCGMDAETADSVFEPFFTTKELGKGTGLGLATVYGIVKQNNGFINVYSEPGRGTTFKIFLPQHMTRRAAHLPEKEAGQQAERGHETILLVEDEPSILRMAKMMLERIGYTVVAAGTPGEAIRLAGEYAGQIQLLITDVVMPEMNGRDLATRILSLYPDLKRLFMSGYTADVIAHHGVLDEGVNFLQKPFSMENLSAKVREALADADAETQE